MKHASRVLILAVVSVTTLVASAIAAVGDAYPPAPPSTAAPAQQIVTPAQQRGLAFTGSNSTPLLWIGLAVLVVGLVLVVATRRRGALRRRGSITETVG